MYSFIEIYIISIVLSTSSLVLSGPPTSIKNTLSDISWLYTPLYPLPPWLNIPLDIPFTLLSIILFNFSALFLFDALLGLSVPITNNTFA